MENKSSLKKAAFTDRRFALLEPLEVIARRFVEDILSDPARYSGGLFMHSQVTSAEYCAGCVRSGLSNALESDGEKIDEEKVTRVRVYTGTMVPDGFSGVPVDIDVYLREAGHID